MSAVQFISGYVSCIMRRGRWHDDIVVNVHAPSEDKDDDIIALMKK